MIERQPIKRSKELVPLSREHHDGLLLCWKIRKGIASGIEVDRISNYIVHFYEHYLKEHFCEEEDLLFDLLPLQDEQCSQAFGQHRELRSYIGIFKTQYNVRTELLSVFADQLDRHIRFEERELFPYIEDLLDSEVLAEIGKRLSKMHQKKAPAGNWDDEFWTNK